MTPSIVVFDIGGVLVDWKPHLAWAPELGEQGAQEFMARTDFAGRNARGDCGENFSDMAQELDDPKDQALFAQYVSLYERTVRDVIPGSWEIVDRLIARKVALHAITNWSAETWPGGLSAQPRLGEIFGVTIVSGQENMMKPDPRIFKLLCTRAGIAPEACVFVDDSAKNIAAAKACGMDAIHFTGADVLEAGLIERGLL